MLQILLGLFAAYILYNFIFRFVIPLVRVTRQVKKQVKNFREQANSAGTGYTQGGFQQGGFQGGFQQGSFATGNYQNTTSAFGDTTRADNARPDDTRADNARPDNARTAASKQDQNPRPKSDDYIDFEEVK